MQQSIFLHFIMLSKADSNHHKQNQNLLCYHYTIGQSVCIRQFNGCKGSCFLCLNQIFRLIFMVYRTVRVPKTPYSNVGFSVVIIY